MTTSALHQTWPALRRRWMNQLDQRHAVAARALRYLSTKPAELERLHSRTGVSLGELGGRPLHPEHQTLLLDFLLADEARLSAFAGETNVPVETARAAARQPAGSTRTLPGSAEAGREPPRGRPPFL